VRGRKKMGGGKKVLELKKKKATVCLLSNKKFVNFLNFLNAPVEKDQLRLLAYGVAARAGYTQHVGGPVRWLPVGVRT
jgi:hypothetical protein